MRSMIPGALLAALLVSAQAPDAGGVYPPFLPRAWAVRAVGPASIATALPTDLRRDAGRPAWRLALARSGRYDLADGAGRVVERGRWRSAMPSADRGGLPWELCFIGRRGAPLAGPTGRRCGGVGANSAAPDTMLLWWIERSAPRDTLTTMTALQLFLRAPTDPANRRR